MPYFFLFFYGRMQLRMTHTLSRVFNWDGQVNESEKFAPWRDALATLAVQFTKIGTEWYNLIKKKLLFIIL